MIKKSIFQTNVYLNIFIVYNFSLWTCCQVIYSSEIINCYQTGGLNRLSCREQATSGHSAHILVLSANSIHPIHFLIKFHLRKDTLMIILLFWCQTWFYISQFKDPCPELLVLQYGNFDMTGPALYVNTNVNYQHTH